MKFPYEFYHRQNAVIFSNSGFLVFSFFRSAGLGTSGSRAFDSPGGRGIEPQARREHADPGAVYAQSFRDRRSDVSPFYC